MAQEPNILEELKDEFDQFQRALADGWNQLGVSLRNQIRLARERELDFVVLPIGGPLPERSGPPRSFIERQLPLPPPPLTIQTINHRFQMIADAGNVQGVVLVFQGFSAGLATLQNLRRAIHRLREAGKKVVVYTPYLDVPHYFAATAADLIVAPPSAEFNVLGLRSETIFLKAALARIGVQADFVQISPYKSSANLFTKSDITPEQEAQMTWLLDEAYDLVTAGMAAGRAKSQADIQQLIDQAPFFGGRACDLGLIDHTAYEDDLPALLAQPAVWSPETDETAADQPAAINDPAANPPPDTENQDDDRRDDRPSQKQPQVRLRAWDEAHTMLLEKFRRTHPKFIGVVSLEGTIVSGKSEQPPVDLPLPFVSELVAGEETLSQLLRRAEKNKQMAALIFFVDSRGGSALASDLIWRELKRLSLAKPVVVFMGNVAASGGYYVAAHAQHIIAQTGTITGSIGVLSGRFSTGQLYQKLSVNRFTLSRGEHADLYAGEDPMTAEEYEIFWQGIVESYEQFKQVVSDGRNIDYDQLDPICEGRVWSGRQARQHKLVDSHGDFIDAANRAAELAELPQVDDLWIPVVNIHPRDRPYQVAQSFPQQDDAAGGLVTRLLDLLFNQRLARWRGRPLYLMPYDIRFW